MCISFLSVFRFDKFKSTIHTEFLSSPSSFPFPHLHTFTSLCIHNVSHIPYSRTSLTSTPSIEGSWEAVMSLIGKAHTLLHEQQQHGADGIVRIHTDIRVGTRYIYFSLSLSPTHSLYTISFWKEKIRIGQNTEKRVVCD